MRFLYFNQIFHIIFPPPAFTVFFMTLNTTGFFFFFCRKSHYFLMHGYLLMYCVYNTLCISLYWWIHLHPLENKNSLKGQSHISLSMLPKYCVFDVFLVFCGFIVFWFFFKRHNRVCSDLLRRSFYQWTTIIIHFLNVDLGVLWQRLPKKVVISQLCSNKNALTCSFLLWKR